jgi:anaerobic magnesium-protoporphyrin IX monomethyl ester cyclase
MSNVLLIIPFDGFRQESPALGVGYLKAYAEKHSSNSVIIHDENFLEKRDELLLRKIEEIRPDFIGMTFPSSAILRVKAIACLVKTKWPWITLFAGGYHPTSEPELTLKFIPEIDFVVRGEGEIFAAKLKGRWKTLPNIGWLEAGAYRENRIETLSDLDSIPFPDRRIYDSRYFIPRRGVIAGIYGRTTTLLSSRGCPYACNFCSNRVMQKGIRFHSTDYVLSEIAHLLSTVGRMDYLYFVDVMFLAHWERVADLCQGLIQHGFSKKLKWAATVSANAVNDEKIRLLKEAGCFYLSFGFESNSPRVLKIINKKATVEDNQRACEICRRHGIYINSAFLFGVPGENEEDLLKTIQFVKSHHIGFTGVNIMKPLPGSPFYQQFIKQGIICPSIDEWQKISSIYETGRIYNDLLSMEQYRYYIEKFNQTTRWKSYYYRLRANWKMRLKYFLTSGLF